MDKTLDYYNQNAKEFTKGTVSVDFSETQDRFCRLLPPGAKVLDFGCGSGRDTKAFILKGFDTDAIDGSSELCKLASEYTGISVKQMLFSELSAENIYDGIWACASVLHLPKQELFEVIKKIGNALKTGGVCYLSFKYGDFEGTRNGRYFTDFTEYNFEKFVLPIEILSTEAVWITTDVRPGRSDEKWLNILMRKN